MMGSTVIQREKDGLKKWAEKKFKLNKDKCKLQQPRKNNPMYQYRLGTRWLNSSFAEKDLRLSVNTKLILIHQCAFVAMKAKSILGMRKSTGALQGR